MREAAHGADRIGLKPSDRHRERPRNTVVSKRTPRLAWHDHAQRLHACDDRRARGDTASPIAAGLDFDGPAKSTSVTATARDLGPGVGTREVVIRSPCMARGFSERTGK